MSLIGMGCKSDQGRNRLGEEKSPYLKQHENNPVWWWAWTPEALEKAKKENKPIFLSVGYSTCHWCHVMEEESFEDEDVAKVLNRDFISIKVDREERPDVDAIYMEAVQRMTGHGGWPMSVWLTPEGQPFYGGTYFPKAQFIQILEKISEEWKKNQDGIQESSSTLTQVLRREEDIRKGTSADLDTKAVFETFLEYYEDQNDEIYGGFSHQPKFPPAMALQALLRVSLAPAYRKKASAIHQMVTSTLDGMARGGIHDHLDGGFHRYSTDEAWLVPHFEKMLYDNAQLPIAYLEAFSLTGREAYRDIAKSTLDYVLERLTQKEGGFYAAEDADSLTQVGGKEKEEGYFYTYAYSDLKKALTPEELKLVQNEFGVTESGHLDGRSVLNRLQKEERLLANRKDPAISNVCKKLESLRNTNPRPFLDRKIITSWNGLMIAGMARGSTIFEGSRYLEAAQAAAKFLKRELWEPKTSKLSRRWIQGEARFAATSDDYASVIHGLLELYQADFDPQWIEWAVTLQDRQDALFWDSKEGGYFRDDASDPSLIIRTKNRYDGVEPSANSLAAWNLLRLSAFSLKKEYQERAKEIYKSFRLELTRAPQAVPMMVLALASQENHFKEVAIAAVENDPKNTEILRLLRSEFFPFKIVAYSSKPETPIPLLKRKTPLKGKTTVYVCESNTCRLPTSDLSKIRSLLSGS